MELIILLISAAVWAFCAYRKADHYRKIVVKAVVAYVAVGAFGISLLALFTTIVGVVGAKYEDAKEERLDSYAWYCSNGDFDSLALSMDYDNSYEEEFDYLWEQVDMYDTYNRYQIFYRASEQAEDAESKEFYAAEAMKCKELLQEICRESVFEENVLYAEYYGTVVWE